eukprot:jgi/Ulvmu1/7605/UM038_0030.1
MPGAKGSGPKAKVSLAGRGKALSSILEPLDTQSAPSATKVIFTIGPACQDVDTLAELIENGGTCARVDLTWGSLQFHQQSLRNLAKAMLKTRRLCAVMVDTLGREIFIRREYEIGEDGWPKHGSSVTIGKGDIITLTTNPNAVQTDTIFPVNYEKLPDMVQQGDQLYIGRYLVTGADAASLYLEVQSRSGTDIKCIAHNDAAKLDGLLTVYHMERSTKGISNKANEQPLFSQLDTDSLRALAAEFDFDFLSLSYTRSTEDVAEARKFLNSIGLDACRIIAKLDAKQSLANFRGILNSADGIMLSRGNLGLDCLPEKVTVIQKNVTTSCNLVGKPCIVTRIVDTMVSAPRPTRAEATDVANAVLDGADCLMLGAETLRGINPVNAIKTVVSCCHAAEVEFDHASHFEYLMSEAVKAQEGGIAVPGGPDPDTPETPEGSGHGGSHFGALGGVSSGRHNSSAAAAANLAASASHANLSTSLRAMTRTAPSSANLASSQSTLGGLSEDSGKHHMSFLAKLEALASSSVRAAEKAGAKLIIVFTDTGLTSALVAKYRPSVPILTLVIPRLVNENLSWKIVGRHVARQCLLTRGLVPMLAAPSPDGEQVLRDAVQAATSRRLLGPGDLAICVEKISGDYCIKMVSVDPSGDGVQDASTDTGAHGRLPQSSPLLHTNTLLRR